MKNHTLMQTIARANRVWREKQNGLIVDYVGIFRNLQKALAIYGTTQGGAKQGDLPIKDKLELVKLLRGNTGQQHRPERHAVPRVLRNLPPPQFPTGGGPHRPLRSRKRREGRPVAPRGWSS